MFNIGPLELIVVLIIALIVLGPQRLPEVARSVGRGMREFRQALDREDDDAVYEDPPAIPDVPADEHDVAAEEHDPAAAAATSAPGEKPAASD